MSHGNTVHHVGECWCCGRSPAELTENGTCVDEFACLEAWTLLAVDYRRARTRLREIHP